ncbi:branched-chain amino acid transport system substrate-binding protein [Candidatus Moduliflexus flocculans]|uniref:Branched-chain amino acid transport system substrate-binding protein n=1 Tax=Candidatus Moduliflexus flocculans TaxID=1499966 RepID=A0A0S6W3P5_9BACT|nr:branched-chain amino acid transport system substrate-binding protein [Candidatus Moduliflexus flocculans]
MKKQIALLCIVLASLASLAAPCAAIAADSIYIGLSAPFSKEYAEYGVSFEQGAQLASDTVNAQGGVDGRSLELVTGDSEGEPNIAKRVARKMTEDQRIVAVIGDFASSCSMAAQPFFHRAEMVQISPTSSHPSFAPGSPFSFSLPGTDELLSRFMARAVVEKLQKKNVAVLYLNNDWGVAAQQIFADEVKHLGGTVVAAEGFLDHTTDFIPILEKLRAAQPDALYLFTQLPDGKIILNQRAQIGWDDVTIMGYVDFYSPTIFELEPAARRNLYTSSLGFFPDSPRPEVQSFVKAFKEKYQLPPTQEAALAYDALNLIAEAIKQAGTDRKAIREAMAKIKDFPGVTGIIRFDQGGNVVKDYPILQVRETDFALIE